MLLTWMQINCLLGHMNGSVGHEYNILSDNLGILIDFHLF